MGKDGSLYVTDKNHKHAALNPVNGKDLWDMELPGLKRITGIGDDGTIYADMEDKVCAVKPATREIKWECNKVGYPTVSDDEKVYTGTEGRGDNFVYAYDPATNTQKWAFPTKGMVRCAPAVGPDGTVYAGDTERTLYAIDPDTGKKKWDFKAEGNFLVTPTIGPDGTIYVGNTDQFIYALDPKNGKPKWSFKTAGEIQAKIRLVDNDTLLKEAEPRKNRRKPMENKLHSGKTWKSHSETASWISAQRRCL